MWGWFSCDVILISRKNRSAATLSRTSGWRILSASFCPSPSTARKVRESPPRPISRSTWYLSAKARRTSPRSRDLGGVAAGEGCNCMGYADGLTGGHPLVDDITRELNQVPDQGRYLGGSHGAVGSCTPSMSGSESEFEQLARLSARRAPRERIVHMFNLRVLGGIRRACRVHPQNRRSTKACRATSLKTTDTRLG
jgi:hypothetical protein